MMKKNKLSEAAYHTIKSSGSQRLGMYGLPNIHKANTPLRPILSMIQSPQHKLARWLNEQLESVVDMYSTYCIKDSFTFANTIRILQHDSARKIHVLVLI